MQKEVKTKKLISKKKCIPDLTIQRFLRSILCRDYAFSEEISSNSFSVSMELSCVCLPLLKQLIVAWPG